MDFLRKLQQYLLSGVSFAIPFIACGGIMIAGAIASVPLKPAKPGVPAVLDARGKVLVEAIPAQGGGPDFDGRPIRKLVLDIGVTAFTLMPVILSMYVSNAIAGKPGLVAGAVGGYLATHLGTGHKPFTNEAYDVSSGFLGALVTGLLAGYVVHWLKQVKVHKYVRPIMPILVIPVVSATVIGVVILKVIGLPIADAMGHLNSGLESMSGGSKVVFATLLGAMIAFDMGGPINKAAFFFASGLVAEGKFAPMGAVAAAICIPPMGLGVATLIRRKLWTEAERESGIAALAMGTFGITEGAIPFAAADPVRVIPCIMLGSATGAVIAMLAGVGDHAPHGGPIVIFVSTNKVMYAVAIGVGIAVTAAAITIVKTLTNGSDADAASAAKAT